MSGDFLLLILSSPSGAGKTTLTKRLREKFPDLLFSVIKAMTMGTVVVLVGCYYGYHVTGGPVGVGTATAKSMALNIVLVHIIGMLGTQIFWGTNPRAPIGG